MFWEPSTIEAALIATGVTLLGILITNQAKVSEFRQQWINALRDDAASLITHTLMLHGSTAENDDESYSQLHQTTSRIRLRLNPKEENTLAVIAAMNNMREANHSMAAFPEMNQYVDEFTVAVQKVLKTEWRRVKFGEPLYRVIFLLVILSAMFLLGSFLYQSWPHIARFF
jgi:hypothetical protein